MDDKEIANMYENGIVRVAPIIENLINKFKENKYSIDIQQARLIIDYLLIDREIDEDYIEVLENSLDENKE